MSNVRWITAIITSTSSTKTFQEITVTEGKDASTKTFQEITVTEGKESSFPVLLSLAVLVFISSLLIPAFCLWRLIRKRAAARKVSIKNGNRTMAVSQSNTRRKASNMTAIPKNAPSQSYTRPAATRSIHSNPMLMTQSSLAIDDALSEWSRIKTLKDGSGSNATWGGTQSKRAHPLLAEEKSSERYQKKMMRFSPAERDQDIDVVNEQSLREVLVQVIAQDEEVYKVFQEWKKAKEALNAEEQSADFEETTTEKELPSKKKVRRVKRKSKLSGTKGDIDIP